MQQRAVYTQAAGADGGGQGVRDFGRLRRPELARGEQDRGQGGVRTLRHIGAQRAAVLRAAGRFKIKEQVAVRGPHLDAVGDAVDFVGKLRAHARAEAELERGRRGGPQHLRQRAEDVLPQQRFCGAGQPGDAKIGCQQYKSPVFCVKDRQNLGNKRFAAILEK